MTDYMRSISAHHHSLGVYFMSDFKLTVGTT